jgi:hypothetical protein
VIHVCSFTQSSEIARTIGRPRTTRVATAVLIGTLLSLTIDDC